MQKEPARKLVNFKDIPVLVMTAEASFQTPSAHCASLVIGLGNRGVRRL
jgi:hypothetical protein